MTVTGALPQIGFSLILVMLWGMVRIADDGPDKKAFVILALALGLTPWVNQTAAGLAAILTPITLAVIIFSKRYAPIIFVPSNPALKHKADIVLHRVESSRFPIMHWRKLVLALAAGTLLGFLALPWYLKIAPGSDILRYPGPWLSFTHDIAWFQFLITIPAGIYLIKTGKVYVTNVIGSCLIVQGFLLLFLSSDETVINIFYRSRYMVMMFFWPALVYIFARITMPQVVKASLGIFAVVLMFSSYTWAFSRQALYSRMVSSDTVTALEVYEQDPREEKVILTNAFSMGLYISALTKDFTYTTHNRVPPIAFQESDVLARCVLGWVEGCDPAAASRELKVTHVLIDEFFPTLYRGFAPNYGAVVACDDKYLEPYIAIPPSVFFGSWTGGEWHKFVAEQYGDCEPDHWKATRSAPWLDLIYSEGTTRLYQVESQEPFNFLTLMDHSSDSFLID